MSPLQSIVGLVASRLPWKPRWVDKPGVAGHFESSHRPTRSSYSLRAIVQGIIKSHADLAAKLSDIEAHGDVDDEIGISARELESIVSDVLRIAGLPCLRQKYNV